MFFPAVAMGQKKLDHAIYWGQQEPSPEQDLEVEATTIELICPTSTREEITEIYWDIYQLRRLPGKSPCDGEMEELLHQEILDSIRECLWHKWAVAPQGEESGQHPTSSPKCDPQADYVTKNHATYDWLKDIVRLLWRGLSCGEECPLMSLGSHGTVGREDREVKPMYLSHGCWCSGSCRCLGSCQHQSWTVSHHTKVP